jgi:hypothetical protein
VTLRTGHGLHLSPFAAGSANAVEGDFTPGGAPAFCRRAAGRRAEAALRHEFGICRTTGYKILVCAMDAWKAGVHSTCSLDLSTAYDTGLRLAARVRVAKRNYVFVHELTI